MPAVKSGESRSAYVGRCVKQVMDREGLDQKAAVGKCEGMYDSAHKETPLQAARKTMAGIFGVIFKDHLDPVAQQTAAERRGGKGQEAIGPAHVYDEKDPMPERPEPFRDVEDPFFDQHGAGEGVGKDSAAMATFMGSAPTEDNLEEQGKVQIARTNPQEFIKKARRVIGKDRSPFVAEDASASASSTIPNTGNIRAMLKDALGTGNGGAPLVPQKLGHDKQPGDNAPHGGAIVVGRTREELLIFKARSVLNPGMCPNCGMVKKMCKQMPGCVKKESYVPFAGANKNDVKVMGDSARNLRAKLQ